MTYRSRSWGRLEPSEFRFPGRCGRTTRWWSQRRTRWWPAPWFTSAARRLGRRLRRRAPGRRSRRPPLPQPPELPRSVPLIRFPPAGRLASRPPPAVRQPRRRRHHPRLPPRRPGPRPGPPGPPRPWCRSDPANSRGLVGRLKPAVGKNQTADFRRPAGRRFNSRRSPHGPNP
jgi:hypothetical protein